MNEPLRVKQRGVVRGMAIGLGITVAILLWWAWLAPAGVLAERLTTLGAAAAILGFWLAVSIGNVARLRFFSADAIDAESAGNNDPALVRARAILQNTLEQVLLALLAYAALALLHERSRLLIVALVTAFSVGRVFFWTGYGGGAASRATGFALTFYPSIAGLLVALSSVVLG